MKPFKLQTKHFTLEIYRRGIVFTIASLLFLSGINLCNGNIIILIISIFSKQVLNEASLEYGFIVGVILLLISLFLFYLLIINWRIEIYSECYRKVRKSIDVFGTAMNFRYNSMNVEKLKEHHTKSYKQYLNTHNYLNENQTNLDADTYNKAFEINQQIGIFIIEFDAYTNEVEKINANNGIIDYNPELANKSVRSDMNIVYEKLNDFIELIKYKEKFKIKNK